MQRSLSQGGWVAGTLVLSSIAIVGAADARDRRERVAAAEAVAPAPAMVVDGTPRPFPNAPALLETPRQAGRSTTPSLVPPTRDPASLLTITDEAGMASPLGGDDVVIAQAIDGWWLADLQIATNGTIYVLLQISTEQFDVYRSSDGGETWPLWSTFFLPGYFEVKDFVLAEGTVDRAMVAYQANLSPQQLRVAYADMNAAVPAWTVVVALSDPGVNHGMVADIETDAVDYPSYFVYVAARSSDGNGDDVWFTRSTTQGASFSAGYRVASETAGTSQWYGYPLVGYGDDAYIHLSYTDGALSTDDGLLQRRTPSWADGGLAAWEAPITIDAVGNGVQVDNYAMEPSTTSGNVTVLVSVDYVDIKSRYSTDYGATWPGGNLADVVDGDVWDVRLLNLPSGDLTMIAGPTYTPGQPFSAFIHRSSVATPGTWGPAQAFSTHEWSGVGGQVGIAVDPTRGNRYAAAWLTYDGGIATVRFDAEWRRDPGYPNTEVGFPIAIAGGGQTPPAVAEVDYLDPELEIVFGTKDGNVHVVNHDGTVEAGWPVDIGTLPYDAPVAIGDLVGNGYNTVVSGNETGQVFAFDRNGDVLPGWPYDMGTGAPVFVSIGALGPPHKRYVVAVSGTEMVALNYWGENMAPEWEPVVVPFVRPSAIGDVEGDGSIAEVVSLRGQYLEIRRMGTPVPHLLLGVVGETFSDAPSLADIDGDGDLEIAAPTMSGKMYLFHHTGADYSPAWPITVSPGVRLTAAAVANILGTSEPEIVFAEGDGDVHIRFYTGVEQSGFPKVVGGPLFMPPMLSPVSITGSNVNIGTLASVGHSVRNISGIVTPGWPRNLPGQVEETFAGGDLDNDGRNEIVVLGLDFLTVFDVGIAPASDPKRHWPMYGYDAQRTSCLACVETLSDVDGTAPASASAALEIYPNPFNPATTITYEVARPGPVTLSIFDVHGRLIGTLLDGEHREPNRYSVSYQAQVASGVYFVRLVTAGEEVARKMVVLK